MMNVAVIGNTWATRTYIDTVRSLGHRVTVYQEPRSSSCAGWVDLDAHPYTPHTDYSVYDLIQVIGFSKLIPEFDKRWAGFHPTDLPRGRGRAPLPWMLLHPELARPAATFFRLSAEPDTGPIYTQTIGVINPDWYMTDLCHHVETLIWEAVTDWYTRPDFWASTPQDETRATWLGVRRPTDSQINWHNTNDTIHRVIRAHSYPYPGAWSGNHHIWRAAPITIPHRGVPGRVITILDGAPVVQCGLGHLHITNYDGPGLRVGDDL